MALVARLGASAIDWGGYVVGDDIDAIGWTLTAVPWYSFSVSTSAGELPDGRYDLEISIFENSLENGEIPHLGEVDLDELLEFVTRYAQGEIVERFS